jgi:hypothetical protein
MAARQRDAAIAAAQDVDDRLQRRRRSGQHDRDLRQRCAQHRHVARLITDPVLLLVGLVVLLIDDDEPQLRQRQKEGRPRPDDDLGAAVGDRPPRIAPLRRRDVGMPLDRRRAKPPPEPLEPLRPERDLGQEHQRLPPFFERGRDRGEIGLGLARPRHPVEQRDTKPAALDRADQHPRRLLLIRRQNRPRRPPVGLGRRAHHPRHHPLLGPAEPEEAAHDPGPTPGPPRDLRHRGRALAQRQERPIARHR